MLAKTTGRRTVFRMGQFRLGSVELLNGSLQLVPIIAVNTKVDEKSVRGSDLFSSFLFKVFILLSTVPSIWRCLRFRGFCVSFCRGSRGTTEKGKSCRRSRSAGEGAHCALFSSVSTPDGSFVTKNIVLRPLSTRLLFQDSNTATRA